MRHERAANIFKQVKIWKEAHRGHRRGQELAPPKIQGLKQDEGLLAVMNLIFANNRREEFRAGLSGLMPNLWKTQVLTISSDAAVEIWSEKQLDII